MPTTEIYFIALFAKENVHYYLDDLSAIEIATILFKQNELSVNSRYSENERQYFACDFVDTKRAYDVQKNHKDFIKKIAGLVNCYVYQSCENEDYLKTHAFEILGHIKTSFAQYLGKNWPFIETTYKGYINQENLKSIEFKKQLDIDIDMRAKASLLTDIIIDKTSFTGIKFKLDSNKLQTCSLNNGIIQNYFCAEIGDSIKIDYSDYTIESFTSKNVILKNESESEYAKGKRIDLTNFCSWYINSVTKKEFKPQLV